MAVPVTGGLQGWGARTAVWSHNSKWDPSSVMEVRCVQGWAIPVTHFSQLIPHVGDWFSSLNCTPQKDKNTVGSTQRGDWEGTGLQTMTTMAGSGCFDPTSILLCSRKGSMIFLGVTTPPHCACQVGGTNGHWWMCDSGLTIPRFASFWTQGLGQGWTCDPSPVKESLFCGLFWNCWERRAVFLPHLLSWWDFG